MSYRGFQFGLIHAGRDAGASGFSMGVGTLDSGSSFGSLIDDRPDTVANFTPSAGTLQIRLDRGAGTLAALDHLFIPPGFDLDGGSIQVDADDEPTFTGATNLAASMAVPSAGPIDIELSSSALRYIAVTVSGLGASAYLSQLILTARETPPNRGPVPNWRDEPDDPTARSTSQSRHASVLALGPAASLVSAEFQQVSEAADMAALDAVLNHPKQFPVVVRRPDDADPSFWGHITSAGRVFDSPAPQRLTAKRYTFEFRENV